MENIYYPFIFNLEERDWGVCDDENKKEFLGHTKKFNQEVGEAIKLMSPGQELFRLDPDDLARFQNNANDVEKIAFFEKKFH